MKKSKILILCTILMMGALCTTACGMNQNNGTEAPYEDETNKNANDNNNTGNDLRDAGQNLMDSIKDTGDAIRDGVDNLGNGTNRNNP